MKTLEEVNGQKVWAVDFNKFTSCSEECVFGSEHFSSNNPACNTCHNFNGRSVIFQPYEEEQQEKTFTLSQINDVIEDTHKWCADELTLSEIFTAVKALNKLKSKLKSYEA